MSFFPNDTNLSPIIDNVFSAAKLAKEAKQIHGKKSVYDLTIGSLFDDNEDLITYKSIYDIYDSLPHFIKSKYADSFVGNVDYLKTIEKWVLQDLINIPTSAIATVGGSGAIFLAISSILESKSTLLIPNLAWPSYELMAENKNIDIKTYAMFNEKDEFNLEDFTTNVKSVLLNESKCFVVVNDPCHNPSGYSLTYKEWEQLINTLNELSSLGKIVLLNDIAYIDYAQNSKAREYFQLFNNISNNLVILISFSLSKTCSFYGMRCGTLISIAKDKNTVREFEIVFEKRARGTWSNVNNAAMVTFSKMSENPADFLLEKSKYIEMLHNRKEIFISEARQANLIHYPYKEGFFITLKIENSNLEYFFNNLLKQNIFTVKVSNGLRVGICSCSTDKIKGLANKIKSCI